MIDVDLICRPQVQVTLEPLGFFESGPGKNTPEPQLSTGETWEIPEYVATIK